MKRERKHENKKENKQISTENLELEQRSAAVEGR